MLFRIVGFINSDYVIEVYPGNRYYKYFGVLVRVYDKKDILYFKYDNIDYMIQESLNYIMVGALKNEKKSYSI